MGKKVWKPDQIPMPSYKRGAVEWNITDEYDCTIYLHYKNKAFYGEWLIYDEKADDWDSKPMSPEEVKEIVEKKNLVAAFKAFAQMPLSNPNYADISLYK